MIRGRRRTTPPFSKHGEVLAFQFRVGKRTGQRGAVELIQPLTARDGARCGVVDPSVIW
jgi:hypothetical protein